MPDEWNVDATDIHLSDTELVLDNDDDDDGVDDLYDAFPLDPAAALDYDQDGMPDNWNEGATEQQIADSSLILDEDDDNDGIPDLEDPEPLYPHYFYGTSAYFSEPFGGATIDDNGYFLVPEGADQLAGFINTETYQYPMFFKYGGRLFFEASVPSGDLADIRFRFDVRPNAEIGSDTETDQFYETDIITLSGSSPQSYTIDIPPQGDVSFQSLILIIDSREVPVDIRYPYVEATPEPMYARFDDPFGGFIADGDYFERPVDAEANAGVANSNPDFFPLYFPGGGTVSFMAEIPQGSEAASIFFRFEDAPNQDNTISIETDPILISGGPQQYVVDVPAQGWDQRFESFQMYITEPGDSVIVWNVEVEVLYDTDSDGDGVSDAYDAFPYDPEASVDNDYDGLPDDWNESATDEQIRDSILILDDDDDNDGVSDAIDASPMTPQRR